MAAPKKREWTTTDEGTVVCFASETYDCVVVDAGRGPFLMAGELTDFHDAQISRCTKEINGLLGELVAGRKDPRQELSILLTEDGPMLAWVRCSMMDKSDGDAVRRALHITS